MIRNKGATRTSFLPVRTKHEVVNHQLAAAFKKIPEADFPLRSFESIVFVHSNPGQCPALRVNPVSRAGQFFFLEQQFLPFPYPFFTGNDSMVILRRWWLQGGFRVGIHKMWVSSPRRTACTPPDRCIDFFSIIGDSGFQGFIPVEPK